MRGRSWILAGLVACNFTGCGGGADSVSDPATAPEAVAAPEKPVDPGALYDSCRSRVEGPEADGECAANDECDVGGCNTTVCTTKTVVKAGFMTTCDVEPCAPILDACECKSGRCQWTVKVP